MSRDDLETVQKEMVIAPTGVLSWFLAVWIEIYHKKLQRE
jgi:hypothetical protein